MELRDDSGDQWTPGERIIAQWARHVRKLHSNVRASTGRHRPSMSLVLKAQDVSRFLTVSDGDGFLVAGLRVRLFGMDAPEIDQSCLDENGEEWPCGDRARWRLFEILSGNEIEVRVIDVDRYGRLVAVCYINGQDVGDIMVRDGLAVCYGSRRYRDAEMDAIRCRRGIWRGAYEEPQSWRKRHRRAAGRTRGKVAVGRDHGAAMHDGRRGGWDELQQNFRLLLEKARSWTSAHSDRE